MRKLSRRELLPVGGGGRCSRTVYDYCSSNLASMYGALITAYQQAKDETSPLHRYHKKYSLKLISAIMQDPCAQEFIVNRLLYLMQMGRDDNANNTNNAISSVL